MENQNRAASLAAVPIAARVNIRATNGFFVAGRGPGGAPGVVNPGEICECTRQEALDIVSADRGVPATAAEIAAGPMADFIPKDHEGRAILPDKRTRAQIHAAARSQSQSPGRRSAA